MKHQCIVCKRPFSQNALFRLEHAPASAQNIPSQEEVQADRGVTLGLYRCEECGLVQFDCDPVDYYRDVIRAGGFSTTMTGLRRRQYRHLIDTYHLEGKKFFEAGCGRGEFLKVLTEFPVEVYGMEHKADLVAIAREEGLNVWQEFPEHADQKFANGPFDVFLSFNFLEHQPQPSVMLQAIYNNLTEGGMGLVTVPALEYIVEQGSYYELIHDHIAYYSFGALRQLLNRNGFAVLEEELVNRDTIAMIVKKLPAASPEPPKTEPSNKKSSKAEPEAGDDSNLVRALVKGYETVQNECDTWIRKLEESGKTLAVWGASHQGFTLMSTTSIGRYARYIIDSAPFKQGRYAPASHLPIVAPEHFHAEPVDAILIVAPGYTDEIAASIRSGFGTGVEILTMRTDRIERLG